MAESRGAADTRTDARTDTDTRTDTGSAVDCVEVVYAKPKLQDIVRIDRTPGMTAAEAVRRSGLAARHPEIESREPVLGVFGVRVSPERPLEPGDRVEICRPLRRDPRDLRRDLAAHGKAMGGRAADGGGGVPGGGPGERGGGGPGERGS